MKKLILIFTLCIASLFMLAQQNNILYVSPYGYGNKSGLDGWHNATDGFADALRRLHSTDPAYAPITEVWVLMGIYYPEYKAVERHTDGSLATYKDMAFVLKGGIKYIGGFWGDESSPDERRELHCTRSILSGKITNTEQAYHVVIYSGSGLEHVSMDGFIIEEGNANRPDISSEINGWVVNHGYGGGIYNVIHGENSHSDFTPNFSLSNCIIRYNEASEGGGGMYNAGEIEYVYSQYEGWQYFWDYVPNRVIMTSVLMYENESDYGSAIFTDTAAHWLEMHYVTITDNNAYYSTICRRAGGSISTYIGSYMPTRKSIIYDNIVNRNYRDHDIRFYEDHLPYPVSPMYSLVKGVSESPIISGNNCGSCNLEGTGTLDPQFRDTRASIPDYRLKPTSPCIINTITSSLMDIDLVPHSKAIGAYSNSNFYTSIKSLDAWEIPLAEEILETPELELVVYPVPASNGEPLNVSLKGYNETVNLRLYSIDGRVIYDKIDEGGSFTINLPDLTAGIYIVKAQTQAGKSFTKKIMINK